MTFCLITIKIPNAQNIRYNAVHPKKTNAPKKYFTSSSIPNDAKVITLIIKGPTAFNDIPSIYADIYLGGKIPASPAIELLKTAINIPNNTIINIDKTQAIKSGKKYTISGRATQRIAHPAKHTNILFCNGILF